ncbi:MAG: SDR family oxidoreductase [Pseudomonadota bacterium]
MRVLVTGGGAGIGRAIAESFDDRGSQVHVCDIDGSALRDLRENRPSISATVADVSSAHDADRVFDEFCVKSDGIDVLINNAGIGGPRALLEETDEEAWRSCIDVNLTAPFLYTRRAIPCMKGQGTGVIINISTSSAKTGLPMRSAYVASKAGLIAFTKNAARELGPFGIRCNAVLPGIIDNARGRALVSKYAADRDLDQDTAEQEFLSYVSMRTMIKPTEVAEACVFLASDQARHITGQAIGVDGNMEWEI